VLKYKRHKNAAKGATMEEQIFIITKIEGEYAYLKNATHPASEELFIALALLPSGADVGSRLSYKNLEFTLL